jgi:glycosyltransferase involved in cell wall biosynthesis
MELIVVDDGSKDGTADIARRSGAHVLRHPTNGGYGLSLQHGITAARHELVAITDADGTYPVEELPLLISMVQEQGFHMAVGARQGTEYRRGWWKYPARIVFRWLAEYVSGRSIPDVNSGLRAFKRSAILPYLPHTCLGFSFTTSLTLAMMLSGNFVGYVPVSYHKRIGASKVKHLRDTLRVAQILSKTIVRYNPLKLFMVFSVVPLLLSAVAWAGFANIVVASLFFSTFLIILALGLFAETFIKDRAM